MYKQSLEVGRSMPSYTIYNHRTEIDKIYTICGTAEHSARAYLVRGEAAKGPLSIPCYDFIQSSVRIRPKSYCSRVGGIECQHTKDPCEIKVE